MEINVRVVSVEMVKWFFANTFLLLVVPVYAENISMLDTNEQVIKESNTKINKRHKFTIKYGMGGFNDDRSPEGTLGGDQLALDINLNDSPLSIVLSSEYYTNSPEPTHRYEIRKLYAVNLLYHYQLSSTKNINLFAGGGLGNLKVPESESNPGKSISSDLVNLEVGVDYQPYEKFGFYGSIKYLKAEKEVVNVTVIDFEELIFLVGITYGFSL